MEIRMGIYLNPGNEEFQKALNSKIYVDKTMLISEMNRNLNTEYMCKQTTPFWKIYDCKYACGIL